MIFGIGTDVVQLDRIERAFERFGEHFVRRLLLPEEEQAFRANRRPARFLAMRFAAKEAVVKAMWIRDVGVVQNEWGKPEIVWSDRGDKMRRRLGIGSGHVSLTDEAGLVVAIAVLLQEPSAT